MKSLYKHTGALTKDFWIGRLYISASCAEDCSSFVLLRTWAEDNNDKRTTSLLRLAIIEHSDFTTKLFNIILGPFCFYFAIVKE